MIVTNIKQYTNGWYIGNFTPAVLQSKDFEIAHHSYPKGFEGNPHTHKIAAEYNYIVTGSLVASGQTLKRGDIFVYEPFDISDVIFLEDTDLIIVKVPSVPNDKYEMEKL